ncbi:uncharacterized protein LOC127723042 isoform X5 [Mytilus californianus]|uniref:uncharacterized protein LOC127723042 isoform X4 n=1 Tax=Mytilus californianus TaxID=6549 RepID=UPI002245A061|nr:uncharacterized protein LOC127723042 isoform X4 [Mytilus californianus]XP_052085439.1 uncharacterized protein LOC127723042 isoform X5 [Mytilus californianus]
MPGIPPMVIGGSIISAVSLIFHVIGFSTTYWYKIGEAHMGLWKSCGQVKGAEICFDIKDAPVRDAQLTAAGVLESFALIAFVAALVCAFLKMFVLKDQGIMFVVIGLLNFIAGGLALIGTIVFATLSSRGFTFDSSNFHYSFGLCIVGGIGGIFSGIVFTLAWRWVRN